VEIALNVIIMVHIFAIFSTTLQKPLQFCYQRNPRLQFPKRKMDILSIGQGLYCWLHFCEKYYNGSPSICWSPYQYYTCSGSPSLILDSWVLLLIAQ